ncbi:hypothetical protein IKQ21_04715, partial [bacterium]|nr:hypothetical protein [bacterium]
MNTNFITEERDLKEAQKSCVNFTDTDVRNSAIATRFAAKIAERFFGNTEKDVDIETSLHSIESIVSEYEISDIYVNGNYV